MGYFYELTMENGKDILTVEEVLASLDNSAKRVEVFNRLRTSTSLTDELEGIKDFLEANDYDHEKLKAFVNRSEKDFDTIMERGTQKTISVNWLRVAAVVVPLIGLAAFFYLNKSETNLYAKYYEKESGLPVYMGIGTVPEFGNAMNAFKDDEFSEALSGFENLLAEHQGNDTLLYFLACSNMESGNYDDAIEQFGKVNATSVFREKSEYREALSLIALERYSDARKELVEISKDTGHAYKNQAGRLLEEKDFK